MTDRYEDPHGHYTIQVEQIDDNTVEFAREELDELVGHTRMSVKEFDDMIEKEDWRYLFESKEDEDKRFS